MNTQTVNIPLKKILHVGCSTKALPTEFGSGWQEVRLDIDPSVKPDIVASMTDLSMIKDKEYNALWSSHNIEHLFPHEVQGTINEFFRVLKDGGILFMMCPDMQALAERIAKGLWEGALYVSNAGPICPIDSVYGYRPAIEKGNHFMAHKTGFIASSMKNYLQKAGFTDILIRRKDFDLGVVAKKIPEIPADNIKYQLLEPDINAIMNSRDSLFKEPELPEGYKI